MYKRILKRTIWFYFPEDRGNKPNCTEYHYLFNLFSRNPKGIPLKYFSSPQEKQFLDKVRAAHSNKKDNISSEDLFFIIMDTDKECGDVDKDACLKRIKKIADKYSPYTKLKIILSSRSWEVWINMHCGEYTSPYHSQNRIEKSIPGNYVKTKAWYRDNSEVLKTSLNDAVINAGKSRKSILNNAVNIRDSVKDEFLNSIPSWSDLSNLNILWDIETITWVDILIKELDSVTGSYYLLR